MLTDSANHLTQYVDRHISVLTSIVSIMYGAVTSISLQMSMLLISIYNLLCTTNAIYRLQKLWHKYLIVYLRLVKEVHRVFYVAFPP